MAHNYQLGLFAELVHKSQEAHQVHIVEGSLDLVHQVEGRRPAAEDGKQVRHGHQRPLPTRQQRQAAHVASSRTHLDLDTGVEKVLGIGERQAARPPREERGDQVGEVLVDVGEGRVEDMHDLFVQRADDLAQLALSLADILDLGLQELVALTELGQLLHGQWVDRSDGGQLRLELRHPLDGIDPFGQLGYRRIDGVLGSTAQLAAQRLHYRLAAHRGLHQVQLGLLESTAGRSQLVLTDRTLAPQLFESSPPGTHGLELAAMTVTKRRQQGVQAGLRLGHHTHEALDGGGIGLETGAALGCLLALLGMPGQAALDLDQALGQHPAALHQSGGAHLPLVAGCRGCRHPLVDVPADLSGRRHGSSRRYPGVLQLGHTRHQLGHPGRIASDPLLELRTVSSDLLEFGAEEVTVARYPLATYPGGLMGDLVAIVGPDCLGGRLASRLDLGTGHRALFAGPSGFGLGGVGPVAGFVDHGSSNHATTGADPPASGREPVPVPGDYDQIRPGQRQVDGLGPAPLGAARSMQQRVQHSVEPRVGTAAGAWAHVATDRLSALGGGGAGQFTATGSRVSESQYGSGGPTLAQSGQRRAGRLAARYNDGSQRCPGGCFERLFPTAVHLDQVEQGPHYAIDPSQQLGSSRASGLVEGTLEGIGPGVGTGVLLLGLAEGLFGYFEAPGGGDQGGLGLGPSGLQLMTALLGFGQALP